MYCLHKLRKLTIFTEKVIYCIKLKIKPSKIFFFPELLGFILLMISQGQVVMECKGVQVILVVAAILVLLVGQSSASKCVDECYTKCKFWGNPGWWCKAKCEYDCKGHEFSADN